MSAKRKQKKAAPKKAAAKRPAAKKAPARKAAKKPAARRAAAAKPVPKGPAHQVVHWEIQSRSPGQLHAFYRDVFDWQINTNNPMNYGMIGSGGQHGIDGGIGESMGGENPRVLVYVGVPDINRALDTIQGLGGRTLLPRTTMGPVTMALFQDPEGNTMGLVEG